MSDETAPLLDPAQNGGSPPSTYTSPRSAAADTSPDQPTSQDGVGGESSQVDEVVKVRMSRIIVPLAIGIFLAAMDGTIVASSYASIGSELNQLQNTSWIATGYMLTLTSFQPLYGKLSDIFGRKACLLFAYSVFALGCLLCGLARNMTELIAARALAGMGGGGMTTVVSILVSDIVPLLSRGTWQGVLNIIFAIGSATGAPLGGILADGIGWRWAFLIQVPASTIAIITVFFTLHLPTKHTSDLRPKLRRIDFGGALLLVLAVFTLLVALDRGGNVAWSDTITISTLSASLVLFVLFGVVESSVAAEPFAPKRIIANSSLLAAYLCNLFGFAASMCIMYQYPLYTQAVTAKSAKSAGLALLPAILGGVLGSLASGIAMQKTGKYYWLTAGAYFTQFGGGVVIVLVTGLVTRSFVVSSVGLFFLAVGNGIGVTTTLIALIANAAPADQAVATAVSYLFRSMGSVVGISVGSTLVQNTLRSQLHQRLSGHDVDEIIRSVRESLTNIDLLDPATRAIVRLSYEEAVRAAFWFTVVLSAVSTVCALFIKEKPLARRGTAYES